MAGVAAMLAGRMKAKKSPMKAVDDEQETDTDEATEVGNVSREPPGDNPEDSAPEADGVDAGDDEEMMGDYEAIEASAVADMMAAAKSGDAETFGAALKDFVRACVQNMEE